MIPLLEVQEGHRLGTVCLAHIKDQQQTRDPHWDRAHEDSVSPCGLSAVEADICSDPERPLASGNEYFLRMSQSV